MSRPSIPPWHLTALLLLALPAAAQTPDLVMGTVPISTDANETLYAAAGAIGEPQFTLVWESCATTAAGEFLGATPGAGEAPPHFALAWYDVPAEMPLQVTIESATGSEYSFACSWGPVDGEPDATVGDASIVGDYSFDCRLPAAEAAALHLVLVAGKCDWNLTVQVAWGQGVPNDAASWDEVKALYR